MPALGRLGRLYRLTAQPTKQAARFSPFGCGQRPPGSRLPLALYTREVIRGLCGLVIWRATSRGAHKQTGPPVNRLPLPAPRSRAVTARTRVPRSACARARVSCRPGAWPEVREEDTYCSGACGVGGDVHTRRHSTAPCTSWRPGNRARKGSFSVYASGQRSLALRWFARCVSACVWRTEIGKPIVPKKLLGWCIRMRVRRAYLWRLAAARSICAAKATIGRASPIFAWSKFSRKEKTTGFS